MLARDFGNPEEGKKEWKKAASAFPWQLGPSSFCSTRSRLSRTLAQLHQETQSQLREARALKTRGSRDAYSRAQREGAALEDAFSQAAVSRG